MTGLLSTSGVTGLGRLRGTEVITKGIDGRRVITGITAAKGHGHRRDIVTMTTTVIPVLTTTGMAAPRGMTATTTRDGGLIMTLEVTVLLLLLLLGGALLLRRVTLMRILSGGRLKIGRERPRGRKTHSPASRQVRFPSKRPLVR